MHSDFCRRECWHEHPEKLSGSCADCHSALLISERPAKVGTAADETCGCLSACPQQLRPEAESDVEADKAAAAVACCSWPQFQHLLRESLASLLVAGAIGALWVLLLPLAVAGRGCNGTLLLPRCFLG